MKHNNFTAIILKKRHVFERDLSLVLLDKKGKRIEVIAKGAGYGKSLRSAHLEAMNLIKGSLYKGKNKYFLQEVECQESFIHLKEDLDKIIEAGLLLQLTELSVLTNDPHPEIFDLLLSSFTELNKKNVQTHLLDMSLVQLANHLGFLPNFRECSQCHEDQKERHLHWDMKQGTLHCENCSPSQKPLQLKYRKAMEFFRMRHVSQANKVKLSFEEQQEIRKLTYQLFEAHLQKPLKTLSF